MMWWLYLACAGQDGDKSAVEDTGFVPDLPTATCGVPPHAWLSTSGMGRIVIAEDLPMLSLPAASVDSVLLELSFEDYSPVPYDVKAVAVRYVTQDRGVEREVSALITLPDTHGEPATLPVVMFFHPTFGFQDGCAGSRDLFLSAMPIGLAALGFATITPDYPGILSVGEPDAAPIPFLAPEPLAISSLDGFRALARYIRDAGLPITLDRDKVGWWGQSLGAFTALWADRYVSGYAPAWRPTAIAAAVPPVDLRTTATRSAETIGESTTTMVATALAQDVWRDGTIEPELYFKDEAPFFVLSTVADSIANNCEGAPEIEGLTDPTDVFTDVAYTALLEEDWDSLGVFGCLLDEADLFGTSLPPSGPVPVLIQAAELDQLAWPDLVGEATLGLCDAGYVVEHRECMALTHAQSTLFDADSSINFLFGRFAGDTMAETCVVTPPRECGGL